MKRLHIDRKTTVVYLCALPLLWLLGWTVLYPALNSIAMSVGQDHGHFTLEYFREMFSGSKNLQALINSLKLAVATTVVCGVIGTAFAFIIVRLRFWGRRFFDVVLMVPMMIPGVLFTLAFIQVYGQTGYIPQLIKLLFKLDQASDFLNGFSGIMFVHATTQYLFFYVMVSGGLRRLDSSVYEAARSMGASKIRMFFTITLPLLTPALVGASVLTFMSGIGSFAAPNLLGGSFRVMSVQILMTKTNGMYNLVSVQGLTLAVISILFLGTMRYYETRRNYIMDVKGKPMEPYVVKGRWANLAIVMGMSLALLVIVLPILAIVVLSFVPRSEFAIKIFPSRFDFSNYINFFSVRRVTRPFINSLWMAAVGSGAATVVGAISSYIIVKTKAKIKFLIEFLIMIPWALPASTVAVNMILAFNRPTPFGLGQVLVGTSLMLPMTYAVTRITLIMRNTNAALMQLHNSLEEASRSLGASWLTTFKKVLLPILAPSIIAGAMISFVMLLGDYTISVLMYTPSTMPVSVAMTNTINMFDTGLAMVYGVFLVLITVVVMAIFKGKDGQISF